MSYFIDGLTSYFVAPISVIKISAKRALHLRNCHKKGYRYENIIKFSIAKITTTAANDTSKNLYEIVPEYV
jgi:hypothetical protein